MLDVVEEPVRNAPLAVDVARVRTGAGIITRRNDDPDYNRATYEGAYVAGMAKAFHNVSPAFTRLVLSPAAEHRAMGAALDDAQSIVMLAKTETREVAGFAVARPAADGIFELAALGVAEKHRQRHVGTALFSGVHAEIALIAVMTNRPLTLIVETPVVSPAYEFFRAQGGEEELLSPEETAQGYKFGNQYFTPAAGNLTNINLPQYQRPMQLVRGQVNVARFRHRIGGGS